MNEQTCVDCKRLRITETTGRVRFCADGSWRCVSHRTMFLEAQGVGQPARPVPSSAGSQGVMPW